MDVFSIWAIADTKVNEAALQIYMVAKENIGEENGGDINISLKMLV